jgi:hypothetical protein
MVGLMPRRGSKHFHTPLKGEEALFLGGFDKIMASGLDYRASVGGPLRPVARPLTSVAQLLSPVARAVESVRRPFPPVAAPTGVSCPKPEASG